MNRVVGAVCAFAVAALMVMLAGRPASAWQCDFLTGGGFIFTTGAPLPHPVAKGTFAIGGGCKHGSPDWGHLEYHDHGNGLNAHWTAITEYREIESFDTKQPTGTRMVCGTARTNLYGDVDFVVWAKDSGEPGTSDEFEIRLSQSGVIRYTTEADGPHQLGGGEGGGGNIQLHKPNPSTTGEFGGSCPALSAM